jgi:endoglucanase Acf2
MRVGEATGDKKLRDLGAWLFTTEIAAIEDYWFDVRDDLHPADYTPSVVTMVWGGKGANGTWFSGNPEAVHGINFLPITGASLYLGRWPDYARKNYTALVKENPEGAAFDAWAEIMWMYRSLTEPADALKMWNARPATFKPEAGNSLAQSYAWITAFNDLGNVDRAITADAPFAAVFVKDGKHTHVVWNLAKEPRTITFSDGKKVECAAKSCASK